MLALSVHLRLPFAIAFVHEKHGSGSVIERPEDVQAMGTAQRARLLLALVATDEELAVVHVYQQETENVGVEGNGDGKVPRVSLFGGPEHLDGGPPRMQDALLDLAQGRTRTAKGRNLDSVYQSERHQPERNRGTFAGQKDGHVGGRAVGVENGNESVQQFLLFVLQLPPTASGNCEFSVDGDASVKAFHRFYEGLQAALQRVIFLRRKEQKTRRQEKAKS